MNTNLFVLGTLVLGALLLERPDSDSDRKQVERAVLDYVEAIEQAKPELIQRSVSRELAKFGFSQEEAGGPWRRHPMDYERLVEIATEMKGQGYVPEDPQHEVTLLDVMDKTASAKLSAFWGIDYMHLVKQEGRWQIVHVLWQTRPLESDGPAGSGD